MPCTCIHRQYRLACCLALALPVQLVVQAAILCQLHDQAHVGGCQAGAKGADDVGVLGVAQDLKEGNRKQFWDRYNATDNAMQCVSARVADIMDKSSAAGTVESRLWITWLSSHANPASPGSLF
jgi:hypothetical protein